MRIKKEAFVKGSKIREIKKDYFVNCTVISFHKDRVKPNGKGMYNIALAYNGKGKPFIFDYHSQISGKKHEKKLEDIILSEQEAEDKYIQSENNE